MKRIRLSLPELLFIVGTRAALAAGIGLLVSLRLAKFQRRRAGIGLVTVGGLATVPAALLLARRRARESATLAS